MNVICTPSGVRAWKNASSFLLALLEIHKVPICKDTWVGTSLYLVTYGQQDHTPANVNTLHVHARIQYSTNPVNFGTLPAHSPSESNTAIAMTQTLLI